MSAPTRIRESWEAAQAERECLATTYPYTQKTAKTCSEQAKESRLPFAFGALCEGALHPDERLPALVRELEIACRFEATS
jgi:hypothetical protein